VVAGSPWIVPAWTQQVPAGVSFAKEIQLLSLLAFNAVAAGCQVVPERELEFETREFADLVVQRNSDGARLMFGLTAKGPKDSARIDILTRPRTGHAVLREIDGRWRLVLGSSFLHPESVDRLGLTGLLRALLDERA
jgi:hypothetical protein